MLSVCQRGAHSPGLSAAQSIEDAGSALYGTQLLVDRYCHRALPVRTRRHELGVAWVVARVALHRTAPGLVAEDAKASRVLAWSWRVGSPAFEDLTLVRAGLEVEEVTPHVTTHEDRTSCRAGNMTARLG
jgi:hypothetical protein